MGEEKDLMSPRGGGGRSLCIQNKVITGCVRSTGGEGLPDAAIGTGLGEEEEKNEGTFHHRGGEEEANPMIWGKRKPGDVVFLHKRTLVRWFPWGETRQDCELT